MSQIMNNNLPTCAYAHCSRPMLTTEQRKGKLVDGAICWMCADAEDEYLRTVRELDLKRETELERWVKFEAIAEELGV